MVLSLVTPAQARWGVPWVSTAVSSDGQGPASEVSVHVGYGTGRAVFTFVTSTRFCGHHKLVFHGTDGTARFDARYYLMTTDGRVRITHAMQSDRGFALGRGPFPDVAIRLVVVSGGGWRFGETYGRTFVVTAGTMPSATYGAHDAAAADVRVP